MKLSEMPFEIRMSTATNVKFFQGHSQKWCQPNEMNLVESQVNDWTSGSTLLAALTAESV